MQFKTVLILQVFLLNTLLCSAQFNVSGQYNGCSNYVKDEQYEQLKRSTLYVVCPNYLMENENIQEILESGWNYSEIKAISHNDLENHINEKNASFFSIKYNHLKSLGHDNITHIVYDLWAMNEKINGSIIDFAYVDLELTNEMFMVCKKEGIAAFNKKLYTDFEMRQMQPYLLAGYLRLFQTYFTKKMGFCDDDKISDKALSILANDTLYLSETVTIKSTGYYENVQEEFIDTKELMKFYPYPYRILSCEELDQKLGQDSTISYLMYVINEPRISVFKNGTCIYNGQVWITPGDRCVKSGVLKKLAKKISSS